MSLGKLWMKALSASNKLLPIVFSTLSLEDFNLKLLECQVEWSKQSWTSIWNKFCCNRDPQPSREWMKSSSVFNVSTMHCVFVVKILTRFFDLNHPTRTGSSWFAGKHTLQLFQVLDALLQLQLQVFFRMHCYWIMMTQRAVRLASIFSISVWCVLISSIKDLVGDNIDIQFFRSWMAFILVIALCSNSTETPMFWWY